MTDPATLRELFEACKSGDLAKVKKLLTPQNVNEIGKKNKNKIKTTLSQKIAHLHC